MLQLYQIANLNHGLMMVGPSGSGKSTAWRVLLIALENLEGIEGVAHVIDPKVQCMLTFTTQFFMPSLVFIVAMHTCTVCVNLSLIHTYSIILMYTCTQKYSVNCIENIELSYVPAIHMNTYNTFI